MSVKDERASGRVLITGASSGIGMATAVAFAERGASVALLARSESGLERAAAAVRNAGGKAIVVRADVTDRLALESAVERAAASLGGIDVAVVNAAASTFGAFSETSATDFARVIDLTLTGAVDTIRLALPHLRASEGSLIVVGSVADTIPLPLMSAYTAAKHGLRGFVDALGVELRSENAPVAISLVSPGPVDTPFWENVATQEGTLPPPLPFAYLPEDVAAAIVARSERKRSGGVTVGATMVVAGTLHSLLNPLSERLLAQVARWARSAGSEGPGGRAIDTPVGAGEMRLEMPAARPSLMARGLEAARDAAGSLTRR